jgi:serine protease Do
LALGLALSPCAGVLCADENAAAKISVSEDLAKVLAKTTPETVEDLTLIQSHVKKVLETTVPCTVGIRIGGSSGSGVIVSKDGYVLTAGHVSGKPNQDCQIIMPDGKKLKGKSLGRNPGIDSGLLKITEKGEYPFAEMAKSADLKKGDWCIAIGHPKGWQQGRSPVVRVGRVLFVNNDKDKGFVRTDCTLVGGDSGGPLFDVEGKVIGIHSRIGPFITFNVHVPVDTYRDNWEQLVKGEEIGPPQTAYLGIRPDPDAKDLKVLSVVAGSPAEKAGLKEGDVITMVDGQKIGSSTDLEKVLRGKRPGNEIAVVVLRGEETQSLKVTLAKRPG